jgi:uncharacterized membrane protein
MEAVAEYLYAAAEAVKLAINIFGVIVVVWGVAEAAWHFVRLRTAEHSSDLFLRASSIRERLGVHLLLALDIFIGADLIGTVARPDWASVGVLAAIVAIRIALSFLLIREIAEAHSIVERTGGREDGRD